MNLNQWEDSVRAANPHQAVRAQLNAKISDRLRGARRGQTYRRSTALVAIAAGVLCIALLAMPVVQAEASWRRIAGAMDGVTAFRLTREAVTGTGERVPSGSISYNNGAWNFEEAGQVQPDIYLRGLFYQWDALTNSYIRREQPNGPFSKGSSDMKLSSIVAQTTGGSGRVAIEKVDFRGRQALKAVVVNSPLKERLVLYADPKTDLPFEVQAETQSDGKWTLRQVMKLDYAPSLQGISFAPDLNRFPALSESEWQIKVMDKFARQTITETNIRRGNRLIVRDMQVGADGTVFVTFQAGDRQPNRWNGYTFSVQDNLGNFYVPIETHTSREQTSFPKEGRLELEVFVPLEETETFLPRTVSLSVWLRDDRSIIKAMRGTSVFPDGTSVTKWIPNRNISDPTGEFGKRITLFSEKVDRPTCTLAPAFAGFYDFGKFGTETATEIAKSAARAQEAMDRNQWDVAVKWLNRELDAMAAHERRGYGSWSTDQVMKDLAKAKSLAAL